MSRPVIRSPRLELRITEAEDIARLVAQISDFEVAKTLARVPCPYREADAEAFRSAASAAMALGLDLPLTIALDGELIGGIGLTDIRGGCDFGYWLGRDYWGKGYASEAGRAFLDHAFENYDTAIIRSGVFIGNDASLRVQEKLGFEVVGRRMVHCLARGRVIEHIDTMLTRERFTSLTS
ncbi:MAG: GNAT family N-acetyltransferase [Hyphomicrobiales bacterium]|nr:GNAT family N-acetyltransferase [Hyphomicrobiales bacterium]